MFISTNTLVIIILVSLLVILFPFFMVYHVRHHKKFSDRILADGGSFIMSKLVMEFGYWLLNPLTSLVVWLKISPNAITLFSSFLALPTAYYCYTGSFVTAGWYLTLSSFLDAVDGRVARITKQQSVMGATLDSVMDRFSEMFVFTGLILYYRGDVLGLLLSVSALIGSFLVSYISAQGTLYKVSLPRGLMRRGERALYLILSLVFADSFNFIFNIENKDRYYLALIVLGFIGALAILSSTHRFLVLLKTLKERESSVSQ